MLGPLPVARAAGPSTSGAAPDFAQGPSSESVSGIDVQWEAPIECPPASEVRRGTERLLGQHLDAPREKRVLARAEVRRDEMGYFELTLWLSADGRVSEETLVAQKCGALADATSLTVALASDPIVVVESLDLVPAEHDLEPPPTQPASAGEPRRRTPSRVVSLRVAGGVGFGPLPGVAPGVSMMSSLQLSGFRVELGAHAFRTTDALYAPVPGVGAHLQLYTGELRGCAVSTFARLAFPICLGAELGLVHGEGFGLEETRTSVSAWGAVVVGPAARLPLAGPMALWVEADAVIPVLTPGFYARNLGTLYQAPAGGSRLWVGLEIELSP